MKIEKAKSQNMKPVHMIASAIAVAAVLGVAFDGMAQPVPRPGQLQPVPTPKPLDMPAENAEPEPAAPQRPTMTASRTPASEPTVALDSLGEVLEVSLGKAQLITVSSPISEVMVGEPSVADVQVTGQGRIFVLGEGVGVTNVYLLGRRGNVVRNLEIRVNLDTQGIQAAMDTLLPDDSVEVTAHRDTLFLRGSIRSASAANQAVQIARRFVPDSVNVVNMTEVLGSQQVILQVKVAEVERSSLKNLGINTNINATGISGGAKFTLVGSLVGQLTSNVVSGTLNPGLGWVPSISYAALEREGLVKTLAEPTLTAISGETSHFLAGGEFPFPTGIDENNNVTFEFREFGVVLNFTPVVMGAGRISMQISTEISAIDNNSAAVTIGTSTLRGLTSKRTETTVDLPSGGSLMIAGLLENNDTNTINGVPGLKDLPILGPLFRSVEFQNNQSELIIMVTAFLAKPIDEEPLASLPTDGFVPSSDVDMYLLGRLWKHYRKEEMPLTQEGLRGPYGYIMR